MNEFIISYVKSKLHFDNVTVINRLLGGMSNYTYIIKCNDDLYTIRIPGEFAEKFVDRNIEFKGIKLIEEIGLTNETIFFDLNSGIKIAKYLPGNPLSEVNDYPYDKIVKILKKIHNTKNTIENDYKPFERLEYFESILLEENYVIPIEYINIRNEFNSYKNFLLKQKKVLCHGDSQPSNFIINDKSLYIVDFEFIGNNDPIYDIACFANIHLEDGWNLLYHYYTNPTIEQINRFYLWRTFQALQWFNVAMYKELKGLSKKLNINFYEVAHMYLDLSKDLLKKVKK